MSIESVFSLFDCSTVRLSADTTLMPVAKAAPRLAG